MRQRLFCVPPRHTFDYAQDSRGRASSTPLRYRIQAIKNYAAHSCSCRGFRVGSPPETFDHSPFKYHGRLLRATNHEPRPFGLRCGVPPRQIQTNNDASGSPQRVAGRPPLLSVLITGSVSDGPERLWDGPYGIAVRRWK